MCLHCIYKTFLRGLTLLRHFLQIVDRFAKDDRIVYVIEGKIELKAYGQMVAVREAGQVGRPFQDICVCVCSVWVPCVALPPGGGSSVGPSPLCGSPVWVPCAGPLCGSPVWVSSVWVPCVCSLCGSLVVLRHVAFTRVMSPARSHAPA